MPREVVESPSLKVSIMPDTELAIGAWFNGGLSSARFIAGFNYFISSFSC